MQSPSSLIFLVLLGVWAAYFVQYWIRRRDHLSTARSVEQFTAAMRVLERRDALPGTDLSQPAPRSYAVHPARSSRPQVLVKRAVPAEPAAIGVTQRVTERVTDEPDPRPDRRPAAQARPRQNGSGTAARPRVRPSRRIRGLMLLAAIVELLAIAPLVALGMLPLWALAPATLAVVLALVWVRSAVRAERAIARASRRHAPERRGQQAGGSVVTSRPTARPAAAVQEPVSAPGAVEGAVMPSSAEVDHGDSSSVPVDQLAAGSAVDTGSAASAASVLPDPVAEPAVDVMVPIVDEDDIPLTWDPVPVPRPTYTMKAKAERPEVAPAAVTPQPGAVVGDQAAEAGRDETDGTAYDERRVAGA